MEKLKPTGKYSRNRTRRGNVQVGRLHGKSNLQIVRDMTSLSNLNKGKRVKKKWVSAGDLALERKERSLKS